MLKSVKFFILLGSVLFIGSACNSSGGGSSDSSDGQDEEEIEYVSAVSIPGGYQLSSSSIVGFTFTLSENATIKALGAVRPIGTYNDIGGPISISDIEGTVRVGFYSSGGSLVAQRDITSSSELIGDYRYEDLDSPLELSAGTYSVLGVFETGEYFTYQNSTPPTYDSRISFSSMQQSSTTSGGLPSSLPGNSNSWSNQYYAVNFLLSE